MDNIIIIVSEDSYTKSMMSLMLSSRIIERHGNGSIIYFNYSDNDETGDWWFKDIYDWDNKYLLNKYIKTNKYIDKDYFRDLCEYKIKNNLQNEPTIIIIDDISSMSIPNIYTKSDRYKYINSLFYNTDEETIITPILNDANVHIIIANTLGRPYVLNNNISIPTKFHNINYNMPNLLAYISNTILVCDNKGYKFNIKDIKSRLYKIDYCINNIRDNICIDEFIDEHTEIGGIFSLV